jgi:hypothetical protein
MLNKISLHPLHPYAATLYVVWGCLCASQCNYIADIEDHVRRMKTAGGAAGVWLSALGMS